MNIIAYQYRLPFREPVDLAGRKYTHREGVVLTDLGAPGRWSEASPLPGFSSESLEQVIAHFRAGTWQQSRSLRWAHETLSMPRKSTGTILVSALLVGSVAEIESQTRALSKSSCQAVKLKVGRARFAEDLRRVLTIRSFLRDDQLLRLDANRQWTWDQAMQFGKAVADLGIEYIEEPLADPVRLDEWFTHTGVPYALDESLRDIDDLSVFQYPAALVVKPMLIGCLATLEVLLASGIPLVFSGCYESGIGTQTIAQLAAQLAPGTPVGLDTYSYLAEDILEPRLDMSQWTLALDQPTNVQIDRLVEVM